MSDTELLHKSKPEPVRRLEVFTGTGRRRVWTAEQKAQIVAESCGDGETVTAVARRHGLTPQQLFGWRRQTSRQALRPAEHDTPAFAAVVVEERRPAEAAPVAPVAPSGSQMIEIVIGAATVRATVGIDPTWLGDVLRAVKAVVP
ncbi:IS66-like element accessory protein TnpA [Bradyrhizobium oligotrophicum]|uniref:IS66-like element accessory protein TnpA n=1 Tax=Bradyrhizobium oligotrophicum TaxID=44255 RepID=UPI003EB8F5D2